MGKRFVIVGLPLIALLTACDGIEKLSGDDPKSNNSEDVSYRYVPTLSPDGLWITNTRTGSTTHCHFAGQKVHCAAYASGAGEEPHFRYDPKTESAVPLNEAARISQIYEKYGLEPRDNDQENAAAPTGPAKEPGDMTDQELLDALNLRNQLAIGDIRDCKQFVGGDSAKNESWATLPRDETGVCVPPPSGYIIDKQ